MQPPESAKARPDYADCGSESPGKGASSKQIRGGGVRRAGNPDLNRIASSLTSPRFFEPILAWVNCVVRSLYGGQTALGSSGRPTAASRRGRVRPRPNAAVHRQHRGGGSQRRLYG